MKYKLKNKVVVIVGATGGLGKAYAEAFSNEEALLVLAARNKLELEGQTIEPKLPSSIHYVDLTDPESLVSLCQRTVKTYERVDVVVNATGFDVRKFLPSHTMEEIRKPMDINLMGAIILTHAFLPQMLKQGNGTIVHPGGFADGRMAFPYSSFDVATRAGLYSFVEAVNREINGSGVQMMYFSPTVADTDAERPYIPMWQELGMKAVSPHVVVQDLIKAVKKKKRVHIMGGISTVLGAKLNGLWPGQVSIPFTKYYSKILKKYFG